MSVELGSQEFWQRLAVGPAQLAAEVCFIDTVNLEQSLYKHAGLHAWVNASHEVARIVEERAKWELTKARARALFTARGDATTGKSKTVQVIEAEVEMDATVQRAMEALLVAQEKRGALRAMAEALEDRKDMLIQIAAKHRQEQGNYR